jgi:hypothetical protein
MFDKNNDCTMQLLQHPFIKSLNQNSGQHIKVKTRDLFNRVIFLGITIVMNYLRFQEEYSNGLILQTTTMKLRAVGLNPKRVNLCEGSGYWPSVTGVTQV